MPRASPLILILAALIALCPAMLNRAGPDDERSPRCGASAPQTAPCPCCEGRDDCCCSTDPRPTTDPGPTAPTSRPQLPDFPLAIAQPARLLALARSSPPASRGPAPAPPPARTTRARLCIWRT